MDFEKKIEELVNKIDALVTKYQELTAENLNLKRSIEEKEKEIKFMHGEIEKLKLEKKEAAKSIDNVISKITRFFEGRESESLL